MVLFLLQHHPCSLSSKYKQLCSCKLLSSSSRPSHLSGRLRFALKRPTRSKNIPCICSIYVEAILLFGQAAVIDFPRAEKARRIYKLEPAKSSPYLRIKKPTYIDLRTSVIARSYHHIVPWSIPDFDPSWLAQMLKNMQGHGIIAKLVEKSSRALISHATQISDQSCDLIH